MGQQETALMLKRASASRSSGEWNDDDFDVLADGVVGSHLQGQRGGRRLALDVDLSFRAPRRSNADAQLCREPRGRDGSPRAGGGSKRGTTDTPKCCTGGALTRRLLRQWPTRVPGSPALCCWGRGSRMGNEVVASRAEHYRQLARDYQQ
jgi:hypothetical protein